MRAHPLEVSAPAPGKAMRFLQPRFPQIGRAGDGPRAIFCAASGQGKSSAAMKFMEEYLRICERVYIVSTTIHLDKGYEHMKELIKKKYKDEDNSVSNSPNLFKPLRQDQADSLVNNRAIHGCFANHFSLELKICGDHCCQIVCFHDLLEFMSRPFGTILRVWCNLCFRTKYFLFECFLLTFSPKLGEPALQLSK